MLAALVALSLAQCSPEPPPMPESERVWLEMPYEQMGPAPRNTRVFLGGRVDLTLDEGTLGAPILAVFLLDESGAELPFTRVGRVLTPDALLPADQTITLDVRLTEDHPCPDCVNLTSGTFTTSDIVDDEVLPLGEAPVPEAIFLPASLEPCSTPPDRVFATLRANIDVDEPVFVRGFGGRRRAVGPLATALLLPYNTAVSNGLLPEPRPSVGERVLLGAFVEDLVGNRAMSHVFTVRVSASLEDEFGFPTSAASPPETCVVAEPAAIDVPARLPRNGVVRTRLVVEDRAFTLTSEGGDTRALARAGAGDDEDVLALPSDVAPGSFTLAAAPCPTCVCPACGPATRAVVVDDVRDEEPPAAPVFTSVALSSRAADEGGADCSLVGPVVELRVTAGDDDTTARADLRYDVTARVDDGPAQVLARNLAPDADGEDDVLVAPTPEAIAAAALEGRVTFAVVARDLADRASDASTMTAPMTFQCAHTTTTTRSAPAALCALVGLLALRRRRS